ncbi:MAG: hypothetical protein J5590_01305 [Clostridia bacterium]|nr:hypothetical protein [Clostridia bacterium]
MYTENITIKYSDLAPNQKASVASMLRFFQNAAIAHTSKAGFPLSYLYAQNRAWILISMNVDFYRMPEDGENIKITTFAPRFDRVYGYRCFEAEDKDGNIIAKAASLWIFLNTETIRPATVLDEFYEKYGGGDDTGYEFIRREQKFETGPESDILKVTKHDIDTNHHVNNVRLEEFAEEAVPEGKEIKKAIIFYRAAFYLGDNIHICADTEDNTVRVHLVDDDGKSRLSAQFFIK